MKWLHCYALLDIDCTEFLAKTSKHQQQHRINENKLLTCGYREYCTRLIVSHLVRIYVCCAYFPVFEFMEYSKQFPEHACGMSTMMILPWIGVFRSYECKMCGQLKPLFLALKTNCREIVELSGCYQP